MSLKEQYGWWENGEGEAGDHLLRAPALIERPLKAFANCVTVRCEVGSIRNMCRRVFGKQLLGSVQLSSTAHL
jgi:hypothetical protein